MSGRYPQSFLIGTILFIAAPALAATDGPRLTRFPTGVVRPGDVVELAWSRPAGRAYCLLLPDVRPAEPTSASCVSNPPREARFSSLHRRTRLLPGFAPRASVFARRAWAGPLQVPVPPYDDAFHGFDRDSQRFTRACNPKHIHVQLEES